MIPLIDLSLETKVAKEIEKEIINVVNSKWYTLGPRVEDFETKFAKFVDTKFAIGVNSGTDALRLILRAWGIGKGDKVLTVPLTSPFTVISIIEEGAIPVFCDVDEKTFTIDTLDVEKKIDKSTKAIMPVHIYGNPSRMDEISKIAKKYNLVVVEDACQAHGARFDGKMIGGLGDAAAFSFYPTKNLGAFGDGGIVTTNDSKVAKKIKLLRHGGQTKRFWHELRGINSRLDEIQAAILNIKLKYLVKNNNIRSKLAKNYKKKLSGLPVKFQETFDVAKSVNHLFVIRVKNREKIRKFLEKRGVASDIYYPYLVN